MASTRFRRYHLPENELGMEDTFCADDCKFVKAKFCKSCKDCPFYVETWWQPKDGAPKLVRDCFPKRSILLQAEMVNRSLATQSANEQTRNEIHILADIFKKSMDVIVSMSDVIKQLPAGVPAGHVEKKD
jgi:hypothetical protein